MSLWSWSGGGGGELVLATLKAQSQTKLQPHFFVRQHVLLCHSGLDSREASYLTCTEVDLAVQFLSEFATVQEEEGSCRLWFVNNAKALMGYLGCIVRKY